MRHLKPLCLITNVMLLSFAVAMLLIFFSVSPSWAKIATHHENEFITDSLISIIANPERYDGKKIQVNGFLHLEYEDYGLYLSKEDADFLRMENSLQVVFSESDVSFEPLDRRSFTSNQKEIYEFKNPAQMQQIQHFNGRNVMLNGVYNAEYNSIRDVSRVLEDTRWHDGKIYKGDEIQKQNNARLIDVGFFKLFEPAFIVLSILALVFCSYFFIRRVRD